MNILKQQKGEQELMIKRVKFNIEVSQNENKSKK